MPRLPCSSVILEEAGEDGRVKVDDRLGPAVRAMVARGSWRENRQWIRRILG